MELPFKDLEKERKAFLNLPPEMQESVISQILVLNSSDNLFWQFATVSKLFLVMIYNHLKTCDTNSQKFLVRLQCDCNETYVCRKIGSIIKFRQVSEAINRFGLVIDVSDYLEKYNCMEDTFCQIMERCRNIKVLKLKRVKNIVFWSEQIGENCKQIESLQMHSETEFQDIILWSQWMVESFLTNLSTCQELKELDLRFIGATKPPSLKLIANTFPHLVDLKLKEEKPRESRICNSVNIDIEKATNILSRERNLRLLRLKRKKRVALKARFGKNSDMDL